MIPVLLTIEGIYSYQSSQTIDFTRLTKEKLFGIFGATGSGKSTILEAIVYALYDSSERLGGTGYKYDMMNLKSNRLFIDFQFIAGKNSDVYRIVVESKRNKKNFHDIPITNRKLYKQNNNEWLPVTLEKETIENIIGLNYENFKRIVIIPQGKFQEFLQLGGNDRAKMMMDIFPELKTYDLSDNIRSLSSQTHSEKDVILGQLSQLEEINDQLLDDNRKQLNELNDNLRSVNSDINQVNEQLLLLSDLKAKTEELEQLRKILDSLNLSKEEIASKENDLKDYRECVSIFKSDLSILKRIYTSIETNTSKYNYTYNNLTENNSLLVTISRQLETIKNEIDKKDYYNTILQAMKKMISFNSKSLNVKELEIKIITEENRVSKGKALIDDLKSEISTLNNDTQLLNIYYDRSAKLLEIHDWFSLHNGYLRSLLEYESSLSDMNKDLSRTQNDYDDAITSSKFLDIQHNNSINEIQIIITNKVNLFKQRLEKSRHNLQELRLIEQLNEYAGKIEEGIPCPVCGSIHHPKPIAIQDVEEEIKKTAEEIKSLEDHVKCCDCLIINLQNIDKERNKIIDRKEEIEGKIEKQKQIIETHKKDFTFDGFIIDNEEEIEKEHHRIKLEIENLNAKDKLKKEKEETLKKYQSAIEKIQLNVNSFNTEKSKLQGTIDSLKDDISSDIFDKYVGIEDTKIKNTISELNQKVINNDLKYKELSSQVDKLKSDSDKYSGEINAILTEINNAKSEKIKIEETINESIQRTNFKSIENISTILDRDINIEEEEKTIKSFHIQLASTKEKINILETQLKEKTFNQEEYLHQIDLLKNKQLEKDKIVSDIGACRQMIDSVSEKIKIKKVLQNNLDEKEDRLANLNTLSNLFKGNNFVRYISTIYLEELCRNANDRFRKMTNNQLELTVNEKSEFELIDFMNDGHHRSVKTLSGGQTFQASLSLALSLIDNIRKDTSSSQNFFFLDEGFGSQDKDSIRMIFETLKSLRTEDRIVGIISHVEDLQQQIPASIRVVNSIEGSRIISGDHFGK